MMILKGDVTKSEGASAWMYILRCADDSYSVGSTDNLPMRFEEHQRGDGGKYTSARRPLELVFYDQFSTIQEAYAAELQVKGWRRAKKEALIRGDYGSLPILARGRAHRSLSPSKGSMGIELPTSSGVVR